MINCMYSIISKLDNLKKNILEHSKYTDCDYVLIYIFIVEILPFI